MSHVGPPQPQAAQSVFPKAHVGFDSITTQIEKKLLKRGFQFNVICVGKLDWRRQSVTRHAIKSMRARQTYNYRDAPCTAIVCMHTEDGFYEHHKTTRAG